eukprot:PITA_27356
MEVNLSKSKIFFFNTDIVIQRNISRILGFQRDSLPSKYLGVPLTAKPLHKNIWEPLINKMKDKVRKWTNRSLNLAGRLMLIKAVFHSIPIFMISTLPTPKGVLQQFRNIQRDFLWGRDEARKKWALVSWEKICKPKNHGGVGLDDQEILSNVLGAKFWWRWVKNPKAQWASIWKEKEGDLALFWEDKWQQEPILLKEDFLNLKHETNTQGLTRVKDFWDDIHNTGKWRIWKNIDCRNDRILKTKAEALGKMLEQRMILVLGGQDQLRWGNNNEGIFNIKEAKSILLELASQAPNQTWKNLWRHQGWMKIKLFMWLFHHRKILTWDNIRKRGMIGPSICQLYEAQEENMEHLLNSCKFTSRLWDAFANIFQQIDRNKESITNTLNRWRRNFSDNEVLNLAWALMPSFIIWNIWKEMNKRIFKNEKNPALSLFDHILKQIKEMVSSTIRNLPKNPPSGENV